MSDPVTDQQIDQQPAPQEGEDQVETLDVDRAKDKINKLNSEAKNLRAKLKELEPLAAKAKELEDAGRTELEKLTARAETAERERGEHQARALRLEVAFEKGLTPAQAKRLVGGSREELEADADEILRDFPVKTEQRKFQPIDNGPRQAVPPLNSKTADLQQIEADLIAAQRR